MKLDPAYKKLIEILRYMLNHAKGDWKMCPICDGDYHRDSVCECIENYLVSELDKEIDNE